MWEEGAWTDTLVLLLTIVIGAIACQKLFSWMGRRALRKIELEKSGVCRHCGYDLRFTPDRCPECGLRQPERGVTDLDFEKLHRAWPATPLKPRRPELHESLCDVWFVRHDTDADEVTSFLQANGIAASSHAEPRYDQMGGYSVRMHDYIIRVWEADRDAARALLNECCQTGDETDAATV